MIKTESLDLKVIRWAVEYALIDLALRVAGGNKVKAAKLLGASRGTFYRRLARRGQTDND